MAGYFDDHMRDALFQAMASTQERRHSGVEQPREAWTYQKPGSHLLIFGATYADGRRVELGSIDPSRYSSVQECKDALFEAYKKLGIRLDWLDGQPRPEAMTAEKLREMMEKLQAGVSARGRRYYGDGEEFGTDRGHSPFGEYAHQRAFYERDFGRFQDKVKPANPERTKALDKLRNLKRMRDGTTYEGERRNSQSAMDAIMKKHGITEREI